MNALKWSQNTGAFAHILSELEKAYPRVSLELLEEAAARALNYSEENWPFLIEPLPVRGERFVETLAEYGHTSDALRFHTAWTTGAVYSVICDIPELLELGERPFQRQGCLRAMALAAQLKPARRFCREPRSYGLKHTAEYLPLVAPDGQRLPNDYVPQENFVAAMIHLGFERRFDRKHKRYEFNFSPASLDFLKRSLARASRPVDPLAQASL